MAGESLGYWTVLLWQESQEALGSQSPGSRHREGGSLRLFEYLQVEREAGASGSEAKGVISSYQVIVDMSRPVDSQPRPRLHRNHSQSRERVHTDMQNRRLLI